MKKLLLSIFAVAAAGFGCYSAAAETTASYTIGFGKSQKDLTSAVAAGNFISTVVSEGEDNISSVSTCSYVYPKSGAIQLASAKQPGSLTLSLADKAKVKATKIEVEATGLNGKAVTFNCNGTDFNIAQNATKTAYTVTLDGTKEISEISLTAPKSKQTYLYSVKVYYNSGDAPVETKCATPTFSPAEGAVEAGTVVTISCATADATLTYTVNGESHQSETNTANVTINEATTITATASKSGLENSDEAKATYTIKEVVNATSISDAYTRLNVAALANNAETEVFTVAFEPVVTYVNGANVYIHDGEKYGLIFKYDSGLNAGDKVAANWQSTIKNYSNLYEFIPAATLSANGTADVPAPVEITPAQLTADNQSMIVTMNNVVLASATPAETVTGSARGYKGTVDGTEINLFNNFKNTSVEAGTYNITGIIGVYNTTVQLQPISFEKVQVVETKCATPTFSPESGVVAKGTVVTITCATEDSKLMLFINEEPFEHTSNTYTIAINEDTDISVWAQKEGLESSEVAEASYVVDEGGETTEGTAIFKAPSYTDVEGVDIINNATSGDLDGESFKSGAVTIKFDANGQSSKSKIYNDTEGYVRWYKNNNIIVTPDANTTITKITIVGDISSSYDPSFSVIIGETTEPVVATAGAGTGTWTPSQAINAAITLNASKHQVRFNYIAIDYKGDGTGVEDMTVADENAPVEYYNLQGIRISEPAAGSMVIRRQGNTVTKVLVK